MKKYDTKAGNTPAQDIRAKRQMEDRIFNRMLIWLAVAVVAEIYFVIANRFYVHARAGEINAMVAWHKALLVVFAAGLVLFLLCLFWGWSRNKKGDDSVLPFAMAGGFLVLGIGSVLIRFSHGTSSLILGIVPGLAVLIIIFYLYQKEFFPCAVVSALGILTLLVYRIFGGAGSKYVFCLVITLAAAVLGLAVMLRLRSSGGAVSRRGEPVQVLSGEANYVPYFITIAVTAVIALCPLVLGSAVAYYGIWALGAWVFILAVYFTSKLM